MPQLCATLERELFDEIIAAIPKYTPRSAFTALLLDEAMEARKKPFDTDLASFGNYLFSQERTRYLKKNDPDYVEMSKDYLKKVHRVDIAGWKEKCQNEKSSK